MPFINKVTVRGKQYNLENLTDGTHIVRLPTLSGDDIFVTESSLNKEIKIIEHLLQKIFNNSKHLS